MDWLFNDFNPLIPKEDLREELFAEVKITSFEKKHHI